MSPELLQLIIFGIEQAITQAPALAADLKEIFSSGNPSPADFATLRAKVASETYGQLVPDSQLPLPGTETAGDPNANAATQTAANNVAAAASVPAPETIVTPGQP